MRGRSERDWLDATKARLIEAFLRGDWDTYIAAVGELRTWVDARQEAAGFERHGNYWLTKAGLRQRIDRLLRKRKRRKHGASKEI